MVFIDPKLSVQDIMRFLFKFRGTNCSAVAKELGMSRQALHRMIKGETLKIDVFFRILYILDMKFLLPDDEKDHLSNIILSDVPGKRVRKIIGGVSYDTDKMFFMAESGYLEHVNRLLCWDSVRDSYIMVFHYDDGRRPRMKITDVEKAKEFYDEFGGK